MAPQVPQKDRLDRFGDWLFYGSKRSHWFAGSVGLVIIVVCALAINAVLPSAALYRSWIGAALYALSFWAICWFLMVVARRAFARALLTYQSGPDRLVQLAWNHLELLTAAMYERLGYKVKQRNPGQDADGGVDLRLFRDGKTSLVQCKKWTRDAVGVDKVRELYGVMTSLGADEAILVTTSSFTEDAERFAYGKPVQLIDNARLWGLVQAAKAEGKLEELAAKAPTEPGTRKCAKCGADMHLMTPPPGKTWEPFWGCSNFRKTGCDYKYNA